MQFISAVSVIVPDYDLAIGFYVNSLGFELIEDTPLGDGKRWVLVAPPGSNECRLLLAVASDAPQRSAVGNQTGGRVFLILRSDDFDRDYMAYRDKGVVFLEEPRTVNAGVIFHHYPE